MYICRLARDVFYIGYVSSCILVAVTVLSRREANIESSAVTAVAN